MDATSKDVSEFVRLMFCLKKIDKHGVIALADTMIAASEDPPIWAIELAMAGSRHPDEIDTLLRHVPGNTTGDLPRKMVACHLREDWSSGRISDEVLIHEWHALYPEYPESSESIHAAAVWQYLDEVLLSIYSGDDVLVSLEEARAELATLLEPYAVFVPLLPAIA